MSDRRITPRTAVATPIVALLLVAGNTAPPAAGNVRAVVGTGPDYVYGTNALGTATATVLAADGGNDTFQLELDVTNVNASAGTRFGAHVHSLPCGSTPSSSGGHYARTDANGTLEHREVWLDFAVDAAGSGHAVATRNWELVNRADRSIVIHAVATDHGTGVAGARLACIDLDA